jgi:hypothetical protein
LAWAAFTSIAVARALFAGLFVFGALNRCMDFGSSNWTRLLRKA